MGTPADALPNQAPTRRVEQLIAHYASSHQNPSNEAIHFIAIPLIMLSLCGLIYSLHPYALLAFLGASLVYYARLSILFTAIMLAVSVLLWIAVEAMRPYVWQASLGIFAGAWIIQFIGHKIEGKKPSFLEDIQYLWVGPIFLISRVFKSLGLRW
jgi:uncharacterized membrane protein YGL010W